MPYLKMIFFFCFTATIAFGQCPGNKLSYDLDSIPFYRLDKNTVVTSPIIRFNSDSILILMYTEKQCIPVNIPEVGIRNQIVQVLRIMYSTDSMLFFTFAIDTLNKGFWNDDSYIVELDSIFLVNTDEDKAEEIWIWCSEGFSWSNFYDEHPDTYVTISELRCYDDTRQLMAFASEQMESQRKNLVHCRDLTRKYGGKFSDLQKLGKVKLIYAKTKTSLGKKEK